MKKKLFIGGAALLFAVVTVFNMNLLQSNNASDVSLDAIAVMAQAQEEAPKDSTKVGSWRWDKVLKKQVCLPPGNAC